MAAFRISLNAVFNEYEPLDLGVFERITYLYKARN
jgi:hypothetical protein